MYTHTLCGLLGSDILFRTPLRQIRSKNGSPPVCCPNLPTPQSVVVQASPPITRMSVACTLRATKSRLLWLRL